MQMDLWHFIPVLGSPACTLAFSPLNSYANFTCLPWTRSVPTSYRSRGELGMSTLQPSLQRVSCKHPISKKCNKNKVMFNHQSTHTLHLLPELRCALRFASGPTPRRFFTALFGAQPLQSILPNLFTPSINVTPISVNPL